MFLWISLNSCPLNMLLVLNHNPEIIIVKHLIQGRYNVTRVRVRNALELRTFLRNVAAVASRWNIVSDLTGRKFIYERVTTRPTG